MNKLKVVACLLLIAFMVVTTKVAIIPQYKETQQHEKAERQQKIAAEKKTQQHERCVKAARDARLYFRSVHPSGDLERGIWQIVIEELHDKLYEASKACGKKFPTAYIWMIAPLREVDADSGMLYAPERESSGGKQHAKGFYELNHWFLALPY